jgi:hypothetical protein
MERFKDVDKDGNIFTGSGVLSMVYANGEGVPRDVELARHYVCESKWAAPAELDARLKLLDRIATTPVKPPHFDVCATSTSGTSEGWCASIQVRLNDARRYDEMVEIFTKLTPQGQESFKALQLAEASFEDLRAEKEVDQTGTARGAFALEEQDRLRKQFVSDLKLFDSPTFSEPVTLAVAEGRLNADLTDLRARSTKLFQNTTLTLAGVEETQRAWLKLRDAWKAYAAVVYPTVPAEAIATQLTRERLYHLHKLLTM